MFSRFLTGFLLFVASFASHAAGPLEGLYQWENGPVFYSVIQTSDGLIIGRFRTENSISLGSQNVDTLPLQAKQFDTYTLYSGTTTSTQTVIVNGTTSTIATYSVVGETAWGACTTTLSMVFTTPQGSLPSAQITVTDSVPTTYGITTFGNTQLATAQCQGFRAKALGRLSGSVTTEKIVRIR
jgi:glycine betaine/choline ABC-type transport system substrate-binding protein